MNISRIRCSTLASLMLCCVLLTGWAGAGEEPAAFGAADTAAFANPAREFHPETWFHYIGGNVATTGITADLEAIAGAGIAGVQLFHGQFGGPWPGVQPQVKCLGEAWDGAVRHTAMESRRLGLDFTMQNCPGWAMAGGPWITPAKAMRELVWSRTTVTGGGEVKVALAKPQPSGEAWRDYQEIAVVAFPTPVGDTGSALVPASIRSNREDQPWDKCLRGEAGGKIVLAPATEPAWVEVTFPEPVTLRTVEFPAVQGFNHAWCYDPGVAVTVDAVITSGLQRIAGYQMPQSNWQENKPISLACAEVPARTYRLSINNRHPMTISSLRLFTAARKTNWEAEAAMVLRSLDRTPHPRQAQAAWVDPARLIEVTDQLDAGSMLHWKVPAGNWTVLRLGHVNSGRRNGPAPPEATGWECDKLAPGGAETHFAGYIGRLAAATGPVGGGLLKGLLMDSWECETQTWTPEMERDFARLRGYALRHWLPALTGYIIGDPETTGRFLRDWRATINDLVVTNFFGRMAALGHEQGLALSFETAVGDVMPGDILEYYKHADVPMCEFWHPRGESYVGSFDFKPVKPCVSAARMYGKRRVAAEAFTSFELSWKEHPGMLKDIANMHLAEGVTHLVFHTYTHNPRTDFLPPGTSFGSGIGTPFLRGQTWWKHLPEYTNYLARCGYLLERGRPVSDVLWYLGDELDHKPPQHAPFPAGYRYDYCNPDVLLHRLSVRDGKWVTPEGLSYRLLWLPDCRRMLPETLERLAILVKQGGVLVGKRPQGIATLSGGTQAEARFRDGVTALWGGGDLGKGRVMAGIPIHMALQQLGVTPDVEGKGVVWNHRQADGSDWYFVAAPARIGFRGTLRLRATGAVELWNPTTGQIKPAGIVRRDGETSLVALNLAPSEAAFVVFHHTGEEAPQPIVLLERDGAPVTDARTVGAANAMQVIAATYGDPGDPARRKDVTGRAQQDLERGAVALRGNNEWAGGDPALKTRKKLLVEVRMPNGERRHLEAWENDALELVEPDALKLPAGEILSSHEILAWESGTYQVTRGNGAVSSLDTTVTDSLQLTKPWILAFPAGWGAPATVPVNRLASWTDLDLSAEARAFSGTASYTTEFTLKPLDQTARVVLELGRVEVIARVLVNGKPVGCLWSPPYRLEVTREVKPGVNHLAVEVTNTWFNRLAYDAGLAEAQRKTWTINGPANGAALIPSGLIGPVSVRVGRILEVR